jgi:hypothetical protein
MRILKIAVWVVALAAILMISGQMPGASGTALACGSSPGFCPNPPNPQSPDTGDIRREGYQTPGIQV